MSTEPLARALGFPDGRPQDIRIVMSTAAACPPMAYRSSLLGATLQSTDQNAFLALATKIYLKRYLRSRLRALSGKSAYRTPSHVRGNYDKLRDVPEIPDYQSYIHGGSDQIDFTLIHGNVVWGPLQDARKLFVPRAVEAIGNYIQDRQHPMVVEFGSGDGRNLFALKRAFPAARLIGLELSPVSVELSRRAAEKFQLDVEFLQADVTRALPELPDGIAVCFSCHALEQMPRIFPAAVDEMLRRAQSATIFFEPIAELYPLDRRGLLSRMRARELDRLHGLTKYLRAQGSNIVRATRMGVATNPLNETVELHVAKAA